MRDLLHDFRISLRSLIHKPALPLLVVVTLGLAIGTSTAVFSITHAVLFRPLPYEDPERLVLVWNQYGGADGPPSPLASPDFLDLREQSRLFEGFAGAFGAATNLTGDGQAESIHLGWASPELFSLLGVDLLLGEMYGPEDEGRADPSILSDPNAPPPPSPVILSYALWQRRYGGDRGVLGRSLELNGQAMTIAGVAPEGFELLLPADAGMPKQIDAWAPFPLPLSSGTRDTPWLTVVGRLAERTSLEAAQAEMDALAARLRESFEFHANAATHILVRRLHQEVVGHVEPILLSLLGASGCLLLIACANVAILLLLRASTREREVGIRAALGGSRRRLVAQLVAESAFLAGASGLVGLLLARWGIDALLRWRPDKLPRVETVGIDWTVLLTVVGVTALVTLLCGLAPAGRLAAPSLAGSLSERGSTGRPASRRLRQGLIVAEVALSLVLLIGAGLLLRSFLELRRVDPGFEPDHVLTAKISLPFFRYVLPHQRADFFRRLSDRLAALPGVVAAGGVHPLPLTEGGQFWNGPFATEEAEADRWTENEAAYRVVLPGYFRALKTRLEAGRLFTALDNTVDARPVVLVDELMARRAWPGENAVGRRLMVARANESQTGIEPVWADVVGVVEHIRPEELRREGRPTIYFPYRFLSYSELTLTLRTVADPLGLAGPLQREVAALDPDLPLVAVRPLEGYVGDALAPTRFTFTLIGVFAGIATLLALVGLYGVISYAVAQRSREIGVRLAFGARQSTIFRLIVGQSLRLALGGVALGLAGALALTRLLSGLLFGVTATDPLTFAALSLLLLVVGFAASFVPALRATRVDPAGILRAE